MRVTDVDKKQTLHGELSHRGLQLLSWPWAGSCLTLTGSKGVFSSLRFYVNLSLC